VTGQACRLSSISPARQKPARPKGCRLDAGAAGRRRSSWDLVSGIQQRACQIDRLPNPSVACRRPLLPKPLGGGLPGKLGLRP
jgi:hypothetical protein